MSDLTIKAEKLEVLFEVLAGIETLRPAPEPKGRYALGKAVDAVSPALARFKKQERALLDDVVTTDEGGKPIYREGETPGVVTFTVRAAKQDEYRDGMAALRDEDVTLHGVRMITRAELGKCPVNVREERILIACGLLEDVEPA